MAWSCWSRHGVSKRRWRAVAARQGGSLGEHRARLSRRKRGEQYEAVHAWVCCAAEDDCGILQCCLG